MAAIEKDFEFQKNKTAFNQAQNFAAVAVLRQSTLELIDHAPDLKVRRIQPRSA